MVEKSCLTCEKPFVGQRSTSRFCSKKCIRGGGCRRGSCLLCDKPFTGRSQRRFCSEKCSKKSGHLRLKYGILPEEYRAMYLSQLGLCAICKTNPIEDLDHNHNTKYLRELLCSGCNCGLGNFGEDIQRLLKAADYLRKHNGG